MTEPARSARRGPYRIQVVAGQQYLWCACGRSSTQPFCDGSHLNTGIEPLPLLPVRTGELWLCGCKATLTPPFCDGTHKRLPADP